MRENTFQYPRHCIHTRFLELVRNTDCKIQCPLKQNKHINNLFNVYSLVNPRVEASEEHS